jgi:hypothetical protein
VDEVILEDDLGARRFVGPDDSAFVMTTWHANAKLDEALDLFTRLLIRLAVLSEYWLAISARKF